MTALVCFLSFVIGTVAVFMAAMAGVSSQGDDRIACRAFFWLAMLLVGVVSVLGVIAP